MTRAPSVLQFQSFRTLSRDRRIIAEISRSSDHEAERRIPIRRALCHVYVAINANLVFAVRVQFLFHFRCRHFCFRTMNGREDGIADRFLPEASHRPSDRGGCS
ncbi:hypothetical protein ACLOJK_003867 [Asimina triloba]